MHPCQQAPAASFPASGARCVVAAAWPDPDLQWCIGVSFAVHGFIGEAACSIPLSLLITEGDASPLFGSFSTTCMYARVQEKHAPYVASETQVTLKDVACASVQDPHGGRRIIYGKGAPGHRSSWLHLLCDSRMHACLAWARGAANWVKWVTRCSGVDKRTPGKVYTYTAALGVRGSAIALAATRTLRDAAVERPSGDAAPPRPTAASWWPRAQAGKPPVRWWHSVFRSSVGAFGWRVETGASRGPNFRMGGPSNPERPPSRTRVFRIGAPMTFGGNQPKMRLLRTNR